MKMRGYEEARTAIGNGVAKAHALWLLLAAEADRDGYALKPLIWEGPGEYQRVTFSDGRDGLVRVSADSRPLPIIKSAA